MQKIRNLAFAFLALVWLGLCVFAWCKPSQDISDWERRKLAQMPELTVQNLLSGSFMTKFQEYTLDQFPLRDGFRQGKSLFQYYALGQLDNNGIYLTEGHAAKLEYPLDKRSVENALKKFQALYDQYLEGAAGNILMVVVPDKGYYLAEKNGYPAMDYAALLEAVAAGTPWAEQLDITGLLTADSYYRTDTHWRQEAIVPVAQAVLGAFGAENGDTFTEVALERPFYGVYHGQAALPMAAEEMVYLTNGTLEACSVLHLNTGEVTQVYDANMLDSRDQYDIFLSGAQPLLRLENPDATTDRELIVFRDSFGSSLAPLLLQGYRWVTLIDTRYISPALLGDYVNFQEKDVLFLYSTLVLNGSAALK